MIVRLDPSSQLPLYEQMRLQIVRLIVSGQLAEGQRLPTIRQLAADLGIAKATVSKTYEQLERDGLIATEGRNGTIVRRVDLSAVAVNDRIDSAADAFATAALQLRLSPSEAITALRAAFERIGPV